MKLFDSGALAYFWQKLREVLEGKQDRLAGSAGQLVGFDASGAAAAVDAPFVTAQELDAAISEAVTDAMGETY